MEKNMEMHLITSLNLTTVGVGLHGEELGNIIK